MPARPTNPAGSSNALRGDVLRVLGVVKAATVDQIQRAAAPHLTYRHTTKSPPSAQKTARTAAHTAALADLRRRGLVETAGRSRTGEAIRTLTPAGLQAAAHELDRPREEMGGTARRAAAAGGAHPLAVTETVLALLRPAPALDLLAGEPDAAQAAARSAAAVPGVGSLAGYATEVALPASGTWARPGHGGVQADLVVTAPEDGAPLLFVEVDNCHMTAEQLAAKVSRYLRFFQRRVKDTDGVVREMWRTRWAPSQPQARFAAPHPPLLFVFNPFGARNPNRTAATLADLTSWHWSGQPSWEGDYHDYSDKIPLLVTTLDLLRAHGPAGEVFQRFGRPAPQTLQDALGNPRKEAAERAQAERAQAERRRAESERQRAQERAAAEKERAKAERELRRPKCATCGRLFGDDRWEAIRATDASGWATQPDSHPHLCAPCKQDAIAEEADRARRVQEHASRSWLSRRLRP